MEKPNRFPDVLYDATQTVTVGVLTALMPGRGAREVQRWLAAQPAARRRMLTALCLGGLAVFAFGFAQFGWIGLAAYFGIVVWLVR